MVTLTFKLVRASNQTRLPCEFGANLFSGSRDISYTDKNRLTAPKTEPSADLNRFYVGTVNYYWFSDMIS